MNGTSQSMARSPRRSVEVTEVIEWRDGETRRVVDYLAAEEPLEIRIFSAGASSVPVSVTMRTPGHDLELAAGFLLTEGIIDDAQELLGIHALTDETTGKSNVVEVEISSSEYDPAAMQRNFFAASSCGICGKASIEAIRRRGLRASNPGFRVTPEVLCSLGEKLRSDQAIFEMTGGLHAAGLFTASGELLTSREDIGRHNAVDKIVGWALLEKQLPLSEHILMVSGRGGFELAQKAIAAGIPVMASVSAPSSLAVKLSRELGLTLVGFLRGSRFVIYSGAERLLQSAS
ncbi:Formate dehydrogenase chain D [Acidisarcina polymorpha]|uniref:Sulfur carrier protein FdhD n=2 Tax=Acidisarcina polymorpha TaxID=2211140 RepID=A0A2Z5FT44_9BACT|nr:Formate dehydrogenase chain D [Acidisarcina polymorpha]